MSAILDTPKYAGILRVIRPAAADNWNTAPEAELDEPGQDEIDDDLEGEQETFDFNVPLLLRPGEWDDDEMDSDSEDNGSDSDSGSVGLREDSDGDTRMPVVDMTAMRAVITEASKGVVDGTDAEYKRHHKLCEAFLQSKGFLKEGEKFFTDTPHKDAPALIVAWIMDRYLCDSSYLDLF
ncbi:hypothetical protein C8R44DRAFT_885104 [Mycena epipterygia]|nr:hypothetical protein C8R44DRAFT_885104 [Mycena epipterygia]